MSGFDPLLGDRFGNPQHRPGAANHFMRLPGETMCGKEVAGAEPWRKRGSGFCPSFFT